MIKAEKPENETHRLQALKDLKILDTPLEERFERITRMVCRLLDVPIAAVSLVDQERQWFKSIQGLDASETSRDVAFCAHAILDDTPFLISNASDDPRFSDNPLVTQDPHIRFYAGIPLQLEGNMRIGTLCAIDTEPREILPEDLATLQDLAEMVKSELRSVKLNEQHRELIGELAEAERAALIDHLTRLWNRGGGERLLTKEWRAAQRKGRPISIAFIDIDHYKAINDQHGHEIGDEILRAFSRTVLSALRPYDIVCRWGGDEFLIIFPDTDSASLSKALERLMDRIRCKPVDTVAGAIPISTSIGACALTPTQNMNAEEAVKIADNALYNAKENGRDQFIIANDKDALPESKTIC